MFFSYDFIAPIKQYCIKLNITPYPNIIDLLNYQSFRQTHIQKRLKSKENILEHNGWAFWESNTTLMNKYIQYPLNNEVTIVLL